MDKKDKKYKKKYEACVLAVKAKQPKGCVENRLWGKKINGKTCYNPWAVCRSVIKSKKARSKSRHRLIKIKSYTRKYNGKKIKVSSHKRRSRSYKRRSRS